MNKLALMMTVGAAALVSASAQAEEVTLEFVDHLKMEMIEQDVYVERTPGSRQVFRVSLADVEMYRDQPAYGTADQVHHDPVNGDAVGPYEGGEALGFTIGEWLGASGTGMLSCDGDQGTFSASFENLVPNGVYTAWSFYLPTPFSEPFSTYDLPMGVRDGSESVFRADDQGKADYAVSFTPCLQFGGPQLTAGMAIAYHSDGKTYGGNPGEFGNKTHVHLFTVLPAADMTVASR